jgi:hypothetical protein
LNMVDCNSGPSSASSDTTAGLAVAVDFARSGDARANADIKVEKRMMDGTTRSDAETSDQKRKLAVVAVVAVGGG